MSAPRLNRPVWLQSVTAQPDGAGGYDTAWLEQGMLWAQIKAGSGRIAASDGAAVSAISHRVIVRAAPVGDTARPIPGQRFVDETGTFEIKAVTEHDPLGRYLVCFTNQEVTV